MTAPTNNYLTDAFTRGPTSVGAGAGSTTGVGNGWIDRVGSVWQINSSNQVIAATASNNPGTFTKNWLERPTSENSLNQRITVAFIWNTTSLYTIPLALLRVDSANDNAYAAFIDSTGELVIQTFLNGTNTAIATTTGLTFTNGANYTIDFTATPNATSGTDLVAKLYLTSTPGTIIATATATGNTAAGLQSALSYGISAGGSSGNQDKFTAVSLYNVSSGPSLSISPSTASAVDASTTLSLTATLSNSSAGLTAAVTGGGTISTAAPTSGTPFTYTPPTTGTGTATVTVTDSTDSLTATSTISYAPASSTSIACSPSSFPLGVATPFTLTGTGTSWTGSTKPTVTGGTNAYISNIVVTGQVITGTLNPGSATGTLTIGDSTDSATTTVTAAANVINNIVWHGDSLTYGQNGSNPGTTSATRVAQVMNALGPTWLGRNYGNAGHTLTQMISELTATVNGYYNASAQNNILIVQGGHNDIGSAGPYKTAAQVIALIQTYISTALAAHPWKIIWSTEPPAAYPGAYPALFDSIRDTVNAYMRLNWQSLGIAALSDFALDFRMGLDGCEYNSTLFSGSDYTHPTDAGYTIWGSYDLAAVQSLNGSFPKRWTH